MGETLIPPVPSHGLDPMQLMATDVLLATAVTVEATHNYRAASMMEAEVTGKRFIHKLPYTRSDPSSIKSRLAGLSSVSGRDLSHHLLTGCFLTGASKD